MLFLSLKNIDIPKSLQHKNISNMILKEVLLTVKLMSYDNKNQIVMYPLSVPYL